MTLRTSLFSLLQKFSGGSGDSTVLPMEGGFSQALLYRVAIAGKEYVVRLHPPASSFDKREHAALMATYAGELAVGPKMYFVDRQGIVMDYIPGRTVRPADFVEMNRLAEMAALLRLLHQSKKPFPKAVSPFARFREHAGQFLEIAALLERLEPLFHRLVPSHLDLNLRNILFDDERFWLVDWVNGGLSDPYFDLATFSLFAELDERASRAFLAFYFAREPTEAEWMRFVLCQPIRPFVIGAIYLSLASCDPLEESKNVTFAEFIEAHASEKNGWSTKQIGHAMLQKGRELVASDTFQSALAYQHLHDLV